MTHEELIMRLWEKRNSLCDNLDIHFALSAVVELHKPQGNFGDTYIDGKPMHPYCPECIDPDVYPCPTIRAIEKALF